MKAIANKDGTTTLIGIQGDTWELILSIVQGNGSAMDLTGAHVRGQIRKDYADNNKVADFTCEILTPATNGKVKISLDANTTANIIGGRHSKDDRGKYVYDIEIEDSLGRIFKALRGDLRVLLEVTK